MSEQSKLCVIGIGGAGCRIMSFLANAPGAEKLRLCAIDTDRNSLEISGIAPENCILAGELWRNGRGTGGSVIDGQRAVSHERKNIEKLLEGSTMAVICGGLGGGTASGGIPIILSCASNLHIPAVAMVSTPFSIEGGMRQRTSDQALSNEIIKVADSVIAISNDLLFSSLDPATPLGEAFKLADEEFSRSVLAISTILCSGNLLNADFSDFAGLLWRKKSRCALGVGVVDVSKDGEFTSEKAFAKLLESPLLGGPSRLCDADAVIFTLTGSPDLSLNDARSVFTIASSHIGKKSKVLVGASVDPAWRDIFQFTALAINYEEEPIKAVPEKRKSKRANRDGESGDMIQQTLPWTDTDFSKGIMEKTTPVRWKGEELDVPTFQRRNHTVDTGKNPRS